jgi:hypothetical protein
MTSAARINANRRNALKSTGPKTLAGKQAVRLNALWHGALAVNPLLPGENAVVRVPALLGGAVCREERAAGIDGEALPLRGCLKTGAPSSAASQGYDHLEPELVAAETVADSHLRMPLHDERHVALVGVADARPRRENLASAAFGPQTGVRWHD